MRLNVLVRLIPIVALCTAMSASAVRADHFVCGMQLEPSSGPPGTTFVFSNGSAAMELRLYRDGQLVRQVTVDAEDQYKLTTGSGDVGQWRARATSLVDEQCDVDEPFTVLVPPDTATAPEDDVDSAAALMLAIAVLCGLAFAYRFSARPSAPRQG